MSSLDILIREQRELLLLITKYEIKFEEKSEAEKTNGYLVSLARIVDDLLNKFEAQHDKIMRQVHETSLKHDEVPYLKEDVYFAFTEKYLVFKGHLVDSLPDNSATQSPMASTFAAPNSRSDTTIGSDSRLPKINLPKFSGEYIEWVPFRDIYSSLVHNNDSLNKVQKFYYLKGTLSGEAANLIKTICATEANYDSAWQILESRYHNKTFTPARGTSCHSGKISKQNTNTCVYCEKMHSLSKCYRFLTLTLPAKDKFLSEKHICRNCFVIGHDHNNCGSHFRCIICKRMHHTVLHSEQLPKNNFTQDMEIQSSSNADRNSASQFTSHNAHAFQSVLLYTLRLNICTNRGKFSIRALLDPGSQGSLISESVVQLIGLKKTKSHCKVIGIGNGNANLSKYLVNIDLYSRKNQPILSCTALVLSNLSSYTPDSSSRGISMPDICAGDLADPFFYRSDPIDMILGSDVCARIKIPSESFVHNELFFQNTQFGWVFSGSGKSFSDRRVHVHSANLEIILRSFWEQEEVFAKRNLTAEELACEDYFVDNTNHTETGHYMVNLPFKAILFDKSHPKLDNNVMNAFKRLRHLEISFSKRPQFAQGYKDFMKEYETLGHMTKIGHYPDDVLQDSYFLPHHGVLKEDSTTTKLRVVFDGSSHCQDHRSLNEELFPGPAIQNDLPSILTKWRRHRIAFSADIEKMFRQIIVHPEHRKFEQSLWRSNPSHRIAIYELNTVTYGTTSAPYLAIRVLQKLAEDFNSDFPKAAQVLVSDSYVDDIISGAENLADAKLLQRDLCKLLEKGGSNLRKWVSNSRALLEEVPVNCRDPSLTLGFDRDNIVKTLGIQWNTNTDSFSFKVNLDETYAFTKRSILSESARNYGKYGLDWDTKIPHEIEDHWLKHRLSLRQLVNLKIPRWIRWSKESPVDLHGFCDASTVAYAAVVYSRIMTASGIYISILQAKSKVSPIKTVSIPRLELCAAKLLVQLVRNVIESLEDLHIQDIYYWSESSTVLSWIQKPSSSWTVYVANRVADIQRLSNPCQWKYVPSALNPADCASRGILAQDLIDNASWWFGPKFLYEASSSWHKNLPYLHTTEERKTTKISSNSMSGKVYPDILFKYSNLRTLLRVTSLCIRFIYNCRNPKLRQTDVLTSSEISHTLHNFVKISQAIDFPEEIKILTAKRAMKNSPLLKLMPFLDEEGIIRVGGRLQNASFAYNMKHPIILSKHNPLSKLVITDSHERTLHGGVTLTMAFVNRKFWIISGNQLAKSIIHRCMPCFRYSAKPSQQIMGNLPSVRLNATRPFKHSGVDYAGPIMIKTSTLRSAVVSKGYICLFVCMVTKALHLEAVSDLTTASFLAAFRRFVSRRGACTDIYSDCGTNFVGASKELQILYNKCEKSLPEELRHSLNLIGTNWHFIPPASPNFGGLWEAGVKSVKFHLKRIVNDRLLGFEELSTLLCQIESCLNSRPLCPLSSDPTDFDALTPAHFLIGEPTNCIQEETLLDTNTNRLARWKHVEKLKQHFWKRWHNEYLNRLQARPKWLTDNGNAKIGDLVLISDERCGPGQWLLGRIKDIHPGTDGRIRVVTVSTKNKTLKRPISKICFLPENMPPTTNSNAGTQSS